MLDLLPRPVVIAHRGASTHAPENTLSAFQLAIEQHADALEFDVQLSSDKSVVVIHDHTLDRTTNGSGRVKDKSLDVIQSLNAGHAYGPAFSNEKIPTLDEIFDKFRKSTFYIIELKNMVSPFDDLPNRIALIIKNSGLLDRVLISSFNPVALYKLERLLPDVKKGLLLHSTLSVDLSSHVSVFPFSYQSVHLSFNALNARRIKSFQSKGKLVFSYTLNQPRDIQTALSIGIDGFFTGDPALARRTLGKYYNKH
jgi:glycerophosphoryl diester phosphodiesterase